MWRHWTVWPLEEPELSEVITEAFATEGITVYTGASISCAKRECDTYTVAFTDAAGKEDQIGAEQLLVATGRRPNTDGLGLDKVGIALAGRGAVAVDSSLRTGNPRIWAAGDVTGHPQFVYNAGHQGTMVVANAFDEAGKEVDYTRLPRVTFTSPAIASVGLTDAQAARAGYVCDCRTLPMSVVPVRSSTATPPGWSSSSPTPRPGGCWASTSPPRPPGK
ncbi:hypothetical protein GCM10029992_23040 [Glycomyces albus]